MITLDAIRTAIKEVVAEYGEDTMYAPPTYVDEDGEERSDGSCVYVTRTGKPSCLIGVALSRLGVPLDVLAADNATTIDFRKDIDLLRPARRYARVAQEAQDGGDSWGRALANAEHDLSARPAT